MRKRIRTMKLWCSRLDVGSGSMLSGTSHVREPTLSFTCHQGRSPCTEPLQSFIQSYDSQHGLKAGEDGQSETNTRMSHFKHVLMNLFRVYLILRFYVNISVEMKYKLCIIGWFKINSSCSL